MAGFWFPCYYFSYARAFDVVWETVQSCGGRHGFSEVCTPGTGPFLKLGEQFRNWMRVKVGGVFADRLRHLQINTTIPKAGRANYFQCINIGEQPCLVVDGWNCTDKTSFRIPARGKNFLAVDWSSL